MILHQQNIKDYQNVLKKAKKNLIFVILKLLLMRNIKIININESFKNI